MADLKNERIQLQALENLFRQKRFSEALTFAQKLIVDFPNSYYIGILHVKILKELNRLRDAESVALKMMQTSPDNINLLSELGTISLKLNKFDESYDYFNKVLFQDPFNEEARDSMEKIKGLKKVTGGNEAKGKNLMDFISQPQEDTDEADTVPELDGETLSPLSFGVRLEPMEAEEAPAETIETLEDFEAVDTVEPIETVETIESIEPVDAIELSSMAPMMNGQGVETEVMDISQLEETPGITEVPEVGDVAVEVDSLNSHAMEPYTEFSNEETVESAEEPESLAAKSPSPEEETSQTMATNTEMETMDLGEPAPAAEFVTESAAELYLSQGLYDDALGIYEKLYAARKEGRFLLRVKQLRAHRVGREKIRRLNELLHLIQTKGA
jgi:tetratricopeptide (TPR) repeat protein